MLIEIKNQFTGAVLFAHDVENNTLSITLQMAVKASADLRGANLCGADLRNANLRGADLRSANLCGADLYGANLYRADLCSANLRSANLYGADLCSANLCGADLYGADLYGADLCSAELRSANLCGAKNFELAIAKTRILPDEGDVIGWKKCNDGVIVKLLIKSDTKRCHAFGRKCRAERATVLDIFGADVGISKHDSKTQYIKGQEVVCDTWGEDWTVECSGGIHFFITRLEAENY